MLRGKHLNVIPNLQQVEGMCDSCEYVFLRVRRSRKGPVSL